jgi:TM2 domain-containing membrane protein YozV
MTEPPPGEPFQQEPTGPISGVPPRHGGQPAGPHELSGQGPPGYGQPQTPVPPPLGAWGPNHPYVAPKNPAVAVIASLFIPGLGSMISGNGGMGALILILYLVSLALSVILIGIPFAIGIWIWGMVQGHNDAVRWNKNHGIVS